MITALVNNLPGMFNVAVGATALENNTTGFFNMATGFHALQANSTGAGNTAAGAELAPKQRNRQPKHGHR